MGGGVDKWIHFGFDLMMRSHFFGVDKNWSFGRLASFQIARK
jgi:hypothetical protein